MILGNYEKILKVLSKSSGLTEEEISKKVEDKRNKLSGLISKEGAAQVIAAELGISFEDEKLKINELIPGMKRVNVTGKVISLFPVREFNRNGKEGKVANLRIADETSNIKVVFWDVHHIDMIEKGEISEEVVIEISNGNMRDNEIHLGSFSEVKLSNEKMDDVVTEKVVNKKDISELKQFDNATIRAFIVQAFDPRFFSVCPQCKKKAVEGEGGFSCGEHGKVVPEKRALINMVLDDGTESTRAVLFHDLLKEIGLVSLDNSDELLNQKENLLGKEMIFTGNVRRNSYFDTDEFIVNEILEVNPDVLLGELER